MVSSGMTERSDGITAHHTQSAEGSRFVEVMMTVVTTLKQQHRNVLDYVTAACEAALCGQPAPSLLPTPEALEQLMRPAA
jgi:transposase